MGAVTGQDTLTTAPGLGFGFQIHVYYSSNFLLQFNVHQTHDVQVSMYMWLRNYKVKHQIGKSLHRHSKSELFCVVRIKLDKILRRVMR